MGSVAPRPPRMIRVKRPNAQGSASPILDDFAQGYTSSCDVTSTTTTCTSIVEPKRLRIKRNDTPRSPWQEANREATARLRGLEELQRLREEFEREHPFLKTRSTKEVFNDVFLKRYKENPKFKMAVNMCFVAFNLLIVLIAVAMLLS